MHKIVAKQESSAHSSIANIVMGVIKDGMETE